MTGSWCDFFTDLDAARILIRNKKLTWRQFLTRLPRPVQFAVFSWDDPMPFLYWLRRRIISVCQKIYRRK
jgi:predicted ATP-grasp superfamily ATP-dependent carboligase